MGVPTALLFKEGAGISIGLLVVFAIIHIILMGINAGFAMSHGGIFLGVAAAGFITYIIFEYTGLNAQFVNQR